MEHLKAFQEEIDGLFKTKPPISKAKMAALTKGAMKAIKMYKHVVQTVEKFIAKSKPEYKVPGLYIIDSIVRQSRHQYGVDKDLFAARFCKNICSTFQSLYKCPEGEVSKIIRVLNLWQKNGVLPTEVIQPLMDLAKDPQNPVVFQTVHKKVEAATVDFIAKKPTNLPEEPEETPNAKSSKVIVKSKPKSNDNSSEVLDAATGGDSQLSIQQMQLQQLQILQQQLWQQTTMLQKGQDGSNKGVDGQLIASLEHLTKSLMNSKGNVAADVADAKPAVIDKKLLEYDYGDSDEDDKPAQPGENVQVLQEAILIQQLKQMNDALQKQQNTNKDTDLRQLVPNHHSQKPPVSVPQNQTNRPSQEEDYDPNPPSFYNSHNAPRHDERHDKKERGHDRHRSKRSRSRSLDRPRRDRERSRDRRDRDRREQEEKEERERQRKKQGLPPPRPGHVIISSCTLWIGHLSKQTVEKDLSDLIERYGKVTNVFLIKPRGCAYVTLSNRADASLACERLPGIKLLGNALKIAWAPPKTINDENKLKKFWEVDYGAAYIPWGQMPTDLDSITAGGEAVCDESSLPVTALPAKAKPKDEKEVTSEPQKLGNIDHSNMANLNTLGNHTLLPHLAVPGTTIPSIQQIIPVMPQPVTSSAQPIPGSITTNNQIPTSLPLQLPPGVQIMMSAPHSSIQGLLPVPLGDGQVRLIQSAGPMPPGLLQGLQHIPVSAGQGQGLMQFPSGLLPIRHILPAGLTTVPHTGAQLEQALNDLMNNKAAIQAVSSNQPIAQHPLNQPGMPLQMLQPPTNSLPNMTLPPGNIRLAAPLQQPFTGMPPSNISSMEQTVRQIAPDSEGDRHRRVPSPGPHGFERHPDRYGDRTENGFERQDSRGSGRPRGPEFSRHGPPADFDRRGPPPTDFDRRGPPPDFDRRGHPHDFDRRGPPPEFNRWGPPNEFGSRGPPGMWRGPRPPMRMRAPPPRGWNAPEMSHMRQFNQNMHDMNFENHPNDASRSEPEDTTEIARETDTINDADISQASDNKPAKRSRWSNDPQGSKTGLDDASQKLALANIQALAAKFSKPPTTENLKDADNDINTRPPEKPIVDITKVDTEQTVSNVLGQLYDDSDDDDDDEDNLPGINSNSPDDFKKDSEDEGTHMNISS